jgi:hypothetical protein
MARIYRSPYVAKFKAQTTLAIFVVEAGGHVRMGSQTYELNANSLYWVTLDHDLEFAFNDMHVEWHPKLSHFEENLHPNLSHPNRLSCLIFKQGWARSDQRGNFEQITQTCPSRQGLHPAS